MKKGFTTKEGLLAISGLFGAIMVALLGFGKKRYLTVLFISLISTFFIIYFKKLCKICDKSCPCNPDMYFWKNVLSEIRIKKQNK